MRQNIKKNKTPKKTELTSNEFGVILEDVNSNLKLVSEGHYILNKKIDGLRGEMNLKFEEVDNNFKTIFKFQKETKDNFETVFEYLSQIDGELKSIRIEMALIKSELKRKVDLNYFRDYFKNLEKRIKKLETNYTKLHLLVSEKAVN